MDKETFEKQKAFAGEKKPSMLRRCVGHDYTRRGVYLLTLVTEGRRPLFARISGSSSAPQVELTALGQRVRDEWWNIPLHHPQVEIFGLQMMPDHLHGILFVREQMECDVSRIIRGFKTGCGRAYRQLFPATEPPTFVATEKPPTFVATQSQHTRARARAGSKRDSHPTHGLLFAPGFNDRILKEEGQLERWKAYLRDNPRRLLIKREHPDLFRVQRGLTIGGQSFSAIGNRFLLSYPERLQVQCSRRLTENEIQKQVTNFLTEARRGAVLVSPAISKGEKAVMRAAFDEGLPLILLQENGFTDLAKPGGKRMEACAEGRLLILAPWEHHNEQITISRNQCLTLNGMAQMIAQEDNSIHLYSR